MKEINPVDTDKYVFEKRVFQKSILFWHLGLSEFIMQKLKLIFFEGAVNYMEKTFDQIEQLNSLCLQKNGLQHPGSLTLIGM